MRNFGKPILSEKKLTSVTVTPLSLSRKSDETFLLFVLNTRFYLKGVRSSNTKYKGKISIINKFMLVQLEVSLHYLIKI